MSDAWKVQNDAWERWHVTEDVLTKHDDDTVTGTAPRLTCTPAEKELIEATWASMLDPGTAAARRHLLAIEALIAERRKP